MEEEPKLPYEARVLMEKMARLAADTNTRMGEIIKQVLSLSPVVKADVEVWSKKNGGTVLFCTVVGPKEIIETMGPQKVVTGLTHLGEPSSLQWAASLSGLPLEQFLWSIRNFMSSMILVHGPMAGQGLWDIIRYTAHLASVATEMTNNLVRATLEERYDRFLAEHPPKSIGEA